MPAAGLRALAAGAAGAAGAAAAMAALRAAPPGGAPRWTRTNHAGHPVTLLEGPAYALGAAAAVALAGRTPAALGGADAALVGAFGAAACGALDDLAGDASSRGLRGHLGALRAGRVTTGAVKVAGLLSTGLAVAALGDRGRRDRVGPVASLAGAAVVAGSANLANLLDLRPGRALKAVLAVGAPLAWGTSGSPTAAAAVGAAASVLRADLSGTAMLGDTGANTAGALLGSAVLERTGLRGRLAVLALITALTVASERVSFTAVIESTPVLRELDALGRRPRG